MTTVRAKKDLFNGGKCFTKDRTYTVRKHVSNQHELIDAATTNDLGEYHVIGGWWRNFTIVKSKY